MFNLYGTLNYFKIISKTKLNTFEKDKSDLPGHPVKNKKLSINFSRSLGIGFSIANGVALALKKLSKKKSLCSAWGWRVQWNRVRLQCLHLNTS